MGGFNKENITLEEGDREGHGTKSGVADGKKRCLYTVSVIFDRFKRKTEGVKFS